MWISYDTHISQNIILVWILFNHLKIQKLLLAEACDKTQWPKALDSLLAAHRRQPQDAGELQPQRLIAWRAQEHKELLSFLNPVCPETDRAHLSTEFLLEICR